MAKRKRALVGVGKGTSFTPTDTFRNVITGKEETVTEEMFDLINTHPSKIDVIMTALWVLNDQIKNPSSSAPNVSFEGLGEQLEPLKKLRELERLGELNRLSELEQRIAHIQQTVGLIASNPLFVAQFNSMPTQQPPNVPTPPITPSAPVQKKQEATLDEIEGNVDLGSFGLNLD